MAIVKKREIENLQQLSGEELDKFIANLPGTQDQFDRLFDYLEIKLENSPCDHTSRFTMQFIMQNLMDFGKVSNWLSRNGGYCDCKVNEEIAPLWWEKFGEV